LGVVVTLAAGFAVGAVNKPRSSGASPVARRDPGTMPRLEKPDYLPEPARALLRERMDRHGNDMMLLMATVLMLQYPAAEELALNIALEPKLVRPQPGDLESINRLLPVRFFELQDQLAARARSVAAAAKTGDDAKVVQAYGRLAETCVACHSAYLRGPPESEPE
jgi:hypothetical protein